MIWSYGVIAGMGLTLSYSIRSRLNINNTKSDRLLQSGPLPGEENQYFPSTKEKIGDLNIASREELNALDIRIADLRDGLRATQEETRQVVVHGDRAKSLASFLEGTSKRYDGLLKESRLVLKALGVDGDKESTSTPDGAATPSAGQSRARPSGLVVVRSERRTRPPNRSAGPSL
ncbi:hypothetical protein ACIRPH_17325 [Nocardiopsis sp. NPDC101807]|uniref:hypothetical protein n=1 Tax=Nocardiopsis sp. NPDC101807 TaxID=3364339 RepID=UPI0037F7AC72